jgi:hypothetical protein
MDQARESEPQKFSLPSESDLRYHWVHARLAAIDVNEMRELVEDAWAFCVPKRVAENTRRTPTRRTPSRPDVLLAAIPASRRRSCERIGEALVRWSRAT